MPAGRYGTRHGRRYPTGLEPTGSSTTAPFMFTLSLAVALAALAVSVRFFRRARREEPADLPPHHPSLPTLGESRRDG